MSSENLAQGSPTSPAAPQAQGQQQARHTMIARKANKLLDVTIDDSLRNSLLFVDSMDSWAREDNGKKTLKPALEKHILELHHRFVTELNTVQNCFEDLHSCVQDLTVATTDAQEAVSEAKHEAAALASSVALLRAEMDEVKEKERYVDKFINEYQLTPDELAVLKNESITPRFIQVLNRARSIHQQCRELLSVEHQQAAVEVMESLYLVQMAAHEKLSKYVMTAASEVLAADTLPEINDFFLSAVDALRERPAQRMKVLHEIARVRRGAVVRRFFDILTKDSGRNSKALESLLPDVTRFFADVMAWMHHCIAEESDIVQCFFTPADSAAQNANTAEGQDALHAASSHSFIEIGPQEILDQIFEGVCKHIQGKFESALELAVPGNNAADGAAEGKLTSQGLTKQLHALTTLFRVDGILAFYVNTVSDLLGENAALSTMIRNTKLAVLKAFYDVLKVVTDAGMVPHHINEDLSTPDETQQLLQVLKEMLDVVQTSMMPHAQREAEIGPVLGAIIDPIPRLTRVAELPNQLLINLCRKRGDSSIDDIAVPLESETIATATDPAFVSLVRCVLRINILSSVKLVLLQYVFTEKKRDKVNDDLQVETDAYVENAAKMLCVKLGFDSKLQSIKDGVAVDQAAIKDTLQGFYQYVYSVGNLSIPLLPCIHTVSLRSTQAARVSKIVCDTYEELYMHVVNSLFNGDEAAAKEIAFHTPQQMKVLLDVQ